MADLRDDLAELERQELRLKERQNRQVRFSAGNTEYRLASLLQQCKHPNSLHFKPFLSLQKEPSSPTIPTLPISRLTLNDGLKATLTF